MSDSRPYSDEELATAHQAAKDFMDNFKGEEGAVTARDLAFFDYGFKRGRRTPGPATAAYAAAIRDRNSGIKSFLSEELAELQAAFVAEHEPAEPAQPE
jgi:hypothetical protein